MIYLTGSRGREYPILQGGLPDGKSGGAADNVSRRMNRTPWMTTNNHKSSKGYKYLITCTALLR